MLLHERIIDFSKYSTISIVAIFTFVSEPILQSTNLAVLVTYGLAITFAVIAFVFCLKVTYIPIEDSEEWRIVNAGGKNKIKADPHKISAPKMNTIRRYNKHQRRSAMLSVSLLALSLFILMYDNYTSKDETVSYEIVPCGQSTPLPLTTPDTLCMKKK
ncbi:hypothetical protein [Photobacterium lipolyticum]|uniref:Uncharacterized protein n=1 Tax=Photobacterium lipolyticum TaxID=266810 RepID=A0A2T3N2Z6_9GAMM|nr:hypothetical protein [Photobacterium lipolyticum]PSW06723.1 hypothetical protein C9I89_04095 [Photobacterium lipolyticum]